MRYWLLIIMLISPVSAGYEGFDPDTLYRDDASDSEKVKTDSEFKVPVKPPGPNPTPAPTPTPNPTPTDDKPQIVTDLRADEFYVISKGSPFFIMASPEGVVNVNIEEGPVKLRGKFADATDRTKLETRTYSDAHVATVEAVAKGRVELLLIPKGAESAEVVKRITLTVMGQAPQPPPGPEPDPDDPPTPPGPVTSFRVLFVKESGATLPIGQSAIPGAQIIREYLKRKTTPEGGFAGWREYDPDQVTTNEQPTMKALWETVKPKLLPAPCLVIEVNGKATVMPFPSNVDDAMKTLKQYGGE